MASGTPTRTSIGPYRITGYLGAGGMGVVWRARHEALGRDVAIKRLNEAACDGVPAERFRSEARLHGALSHPRIAQLYDLLVDDGAPCIVMEYIAGLTLEERLRSGPLQVSEALTLFAAITETVAYVHRRGILHRDIKASNIKLRPDGSPVLLDFGIAMHEGDPRLTRTGMIIGSPHAIAPEQFDGVAIDARADIWALGVLLHEMLTATPPFTGDSMAALASAITRGAPTPPSRLVRGLPTKVDALVARCLERDRSRRIPSADVLLSEITTVQRSVSGRAAWPSRSLPATREPRALLLAAMTLCVLGAAWWQRGDPPADGPSGSGSAADSTRTVTTAESAHNPGGAVNDARAASLITRIRVVEGVATVMLDGQQVGVTPYEHHAPAGTSVTLTLRQPGYHDETIMFIVSDNQREYTLVLQRESAPPVTPAFLGLLGWWRRRRQPPTAPARSASGAVTGERIVVRPLTYRSASRTDVGCLRSGNEDAVRILHLPDGAVVAILCDGMGGHAAGEVAAELAVSTIAAMANALDSADVLVRVIDEANAAIRAAIERDATLAGMGTTCVVLRLRDHAALCAHVGDSRAYLVRAGGIYRLTEDHSHVRGLVREGQIADAAARHHPDKNIILRALGPASHVQATTWPTPLSVREGDRFLLSSDGLHDLADDEELLPALTATSPDEACEALIAMARERGAPDNVSVCIVDAVGPVATGTPGVTRTVGIPA